jgi:signal transduction histidine kinase
VNRIIGFFIVFLLPFELSAQDVFRIDSLKRLASNAEGIEKFNLLNDIGFEYRLSYPDTTIYYCEQAYELGKKLKIKKGLSKPLSFIGLANSYKGDYKSSFDYHNEAIAIASEEGDSVQLAFGYNNFGRLFFDQGDMVRAYKNFIKAEAIFKAVNDLSGLSYVYRSLANLYKSQNDMDKALQMSIKACDLRKAIGAPRGILSALMELGLVYDQVKDTVNAIRSLREADSIARSVDDKISHAEINLALGEFLLDGHQLSNAFGVANDAYAIVLKTNNRRLFPRANLLLGRLYFETNKYGPAIEYLTKVIEDTEGTGNMLLQRDANFYLSKLYARRGEKEKAIERSNQYLILKGSLQNVDLTRQIERLQFQLEIEKKEKENEILQASQLGNLRQQKLQNVMLVIIIVFISVLAAVHWFNGRKRKAINEKLALQNAEIKKQREEIVRQNRKLSRRNMELSELNHEKDTLMSIVAHDLKSPINRIKGLTDLLELEEENPAEQKTYLQLIKNATQAGLDLIKDLLDVNMLEENVLPKYAKVDLNTFLTEKLESFQQAANQKRVKLHCEIAGGSEVITDVDYLGRIVDNLVSNAIKFSRPGLDIHIAAGGTDARFWVKVKDQGPGFSEKDKLMLFQKFKKLSARPTGGETSNGLGLAIVKTLVDRLEGEIALHSELQKGSEFVVTFPQKQPILD